MNKYIALGNLTQKPESKQVGEYSVTTFGLAVNDIVYKQSEKKQLVTYIDIETWGKTAENCAKFLEKGKKVLIEGKLRLNSWEKNGEKRSKLYCIADRVTFLNTDSQQQDQGNSFPSRPSKADMTEQEKVENDEDDDNIDDIPF